MTLVKLRHRAVALLPASRWGTFSAVVLVALTHPFAGLAQTSGEWAVNLRGGAWVPVSHITMAGDRGTIRFSEALLVGVGGERHFRPNWGIHLGVDAALTTRAVATASPTCASAPPTEPVEQCSWARSPSQVVVLGRVGVGRQHGPFGAALGPAARYMTKPTMSVCQQVCAPGRDEHRQPTWTMALLGSTWWQVPVGEGRALRVAFSDAVSRRAGKVQHELLVTIGLVLGAN